MSSVVIYKSRSQSVIAHEPSQKKSQSKSIIQGESKGKKSKKTTPKIKLSHKECLHQPFRLEQERHSRIGKERLPLPKEHRRHLLKYRQAYNKQTEIWVKGRKSPFRVSREK